MQTASIEAAQEQPTTKGSTMKKLTILLVGAAFIFAAGTASAVPLNPLNSRPVTVNAAFPGENSLQQELDHMFGINAVDADADQLGVGMFSVSTPGSNSILPQFKFEWTANAGDQGVGIFGWNGNNTVEALIFDGTNGAGDLAIVSWTTPTSGTILTTHNNGIHIFSNFSGISKNFFGFYFQPDVYGATTYYSVDSLNPGGAARVLAYDSNRPNGGILFSYEDGTDFDYQDAGFFVESINPVPEPSTMLLLGAGFLGIGVYGRRLMKI